MEVLVRVVDRSGRVDDSKRGDVIAIEPDGWNWSAQELTEEYWRIFRCPITQAQADTFLQSATPAELVAHPNWIRRRYTLNLDNLPPATAALFSPPRTQAIVVITNRNQVAGITAEKV